MVRILVLIFSILALNGCESMSDYYWGPEEKKATLKGERISILTSKELFVDKDTGTMNLPSAHPNDSWISSSGNQLNLPENLALNDNKYTLKNLGLHEKLNLNYYKGLATRDHLLSSSPVIKNDQIFLLASGGKLRSVEKDSGKVTWQINLLDDDTQDHYLGGGGLTINDNVLFVTLGTNKIYAISLEDGAILWQKTLSNITTSGPVYYQARLLINTIDNSLYCLDSNSGQILWSHKSLAEQLKILNNNNIAVSNDIAILPQSNGRILAIDITSGQEAWSSNLGSANALQYNSTQLQGTALISGKTLYTPTVSGNLVAMDLHNGEEKWNRENVYPLKMWHAGNSLFVLTTNKELIAVNSNNGKIKYITNLVKLLEKDNIKKAMLTGPILADGKLIITSSKGKIYFFNAQTGALEKELQAPEKITAMPAIAGGKIYLYSSNNSLVVIN